MKKIVKLFCAVLLSATLTACGSGEPTSAPSVADSDKAAVQEKLNKQDNKTEDTKPSDEEKQTETTETPAETETQQNDTDGTNILVAYFVTLHFRTHIQSEPYIGKYRQ